MARKSPLTTKSQPIFNYLKPFEALTEKQSEIIKALENDNDLLILGYAGTAKTYLALYHALQKLRGKETQQIRVIRSSVATRDIGFLPGDLAEKMQVYEAPYKILVNQILGRGDAWENLKKHNQVIFEPSSFLRGVTFDNCVIIIDEVQNMTFEEINTIYTRTGINTQVIICGDTKQEDKEVGVSGLPKVTKIIERLENFKCYNMGINDIVRSEKVKNWIIASGEI